MPSCSPQFQFINSYLSLFYIGFYLKDMERLKEVRPWPEAVVPMCLAGDWVWPKASMGSLAPPPSILFSSLSVRPSMCPLSACHPPICPSACPSVPSQLLLILSLSQSLERQLRAVLVPLMALRFRLLLLSLRGLLRLAQAKVWAGGEPQGQAMWLFWGLHAKLRVHAVGRWCSTGWVQVAGAPQVPRHTGCYKQDGPKSSASLAGSAVVGSRQTVVEAAEAGDCVQGHPEGQVKIGFRTNIWKRALGGQVPHPSSLSRCPEPHLLPTWPLSTPFLPPDAGHSADHPPVLPERA